MAIWYVAASFGTLYQEKSGNPATMDYVQSDFENVAEEKWIGPFLPSQVRTYIELQLLVALFVDTFFSQEKTFFQTFRYFSRLPNFWSERSLSYCTHETEWPTICTYMTFGPHLIGNLCCLCLFQNG
jgi:hypothetical protein